MSETQAQAKARWRRVVHRYARLLRRWSAPAIDGDPDPTGDDASLLMPPQTPADALRWLDTLKRRVPAWLGAYAGAHGVAREKIRNELLPLLRDAVDRVHHTAGALLDPWQSWLDTLETDAARELAKGAGTGIGIAALVVIAVYAIARKAG